MNRSWQAFLRCFEIEYTFMFSGDRLALHLAADLRLPGSALTLGPPHPGQGPAGFWSIRQTLPDLATALKPANSDQAARTDRRTERATAAMTELGEVAGTTGLDEIRRAWRSRRYRSESGD